MTDTLELQRPHGFLLWRGKKKAVARPVGQELPTGQPLTVTTDGEAFGDVTLGTPEQVPVLEFDGGEWFTQHRVKVKERNAWWPKQTRFLVYPVTGFSALKKPQWLKGVPPSYAPATGEQRCPGCLEYEDGFCRLHDQVVEDDHVCADWNDLEDWRAGDNGATVRKALEPEPVTSDTVIIEDWRGGDDDPNETRVQPGTSGGEVRGQKESHGAGIQALDAVAAAPGLPNEARKQEAEPMPYEKRQQDGQWCVFKEGDDEPLKCYGDEAEADDHLTALRINVEAEESEKAGDEPTAQATKDITAEGPEAQARAILQQAIQEAMAGAEAEKQALADELAALKAELEAAQAQKAAPKKSEEDGKHPAGHYLVVEDPEKPSTWHLRVRNADGDLDHRLMGGAWAALHGGYRGNKYQGPDKAKALAKLKKLYEAEGLDTPGEKSIGDDGVIGGKARGEGQGQGDDPQADGGTDTCTCPECGHETEHERGTPCNETDCPECGAMMTGAEEKAESDTTDGTTTKAGRRIKRSVLEMLREAWEKLGEALGYGDYSDVEEAAAEVMANAPFFKFEHPAGLTVKEVDGEPWLITYTTNAFKDRQKEMFSTTCLEQYIAEAESKGDRGTYDLWHIPGSDFAQVQLQMMAGRFLVEAGPFLDNELGQRAKQFFTEHPDGHPTLAPEGWGCSPEFRYLPEQRKSGTYDWIWIVRRAVLPRAAAANVWTHGNVEVVTMATKQQREAANAVFGEELTDQLIEDGEERTKQLEQAGVAHKGEAETTADAVEEAQEAPAEEAPTDAPAEEGQEADADESQVEKAAEAPEIDLKALAGEVARLFEVQLEPLAEVAQSQGEMAQAVKSLQDEVTALKEQKAMESEVEMPRFTLSLQKARASQAKETEVDADDPMLKMKPREAKPSDNVSGAANFFGSD